MSVAPLHFFWNKRTPFNDKNCHCLLRLNWLSNLVNGELKKNQNNRGPQATMKCGSRDPDFSTSAVMLLSTGRSCRSVKVYFQDATPFVIVLGKYICDICDLHWKVFFLSLL